MRRRIRSSRWRQIRMEPLEPRQLLSNTFTVTTTTDSEDPGTLRWAIHQVDQDLTDTVASPDRIDFDIPTTDPGYANGYWTISPLYMASDRWPAIFAPVVVDGYSQPGAQANTAGPDQAGNAVIKVFLDGSQYVSATYAQLFIPGRRPDAAGIGKHRAGARGRQLRGAVRERE